MVVFRSGSHAKMPMWIHPTDVERVAREFRGAAPFPHAVIDEFLDPGFAREVAAAYPDFGSATKLGLEFATINERRKVQVCDASLFPPPVRQLAALVNSQPFLDLLSRLTGIPDLLADPAFAGGGMHETASNGFLDVHVDFNYFEERGWHRRLNLLVFLNEVWREEWGGQLELWDAAVKRRYRSLLPLLGRAVIFETSEISYHGVPKVTCPEGVVRKSFAAYYYTKEAPAGWDGRRHSTVFRVRPGEAFKGMVVMPLESATRGARRLGRRMARWIARTPDGRT